MGLSETLKAISAPVRREILDYLKSGPKSAGEISQQFDLAPATVSHHLSTLRKAGLIAEEKQKNFIYYSLNLTVFEEILTWIQSLGGKEDEKEILCWYNHGSCINGCHSLRRRLQKSKK